jgi:hypothetical protein
VICLGSEGRGEEQEEEEGKEGKEGERSDGGGHGDRRKASDLSFILKASRARLFVFGFL